MVRTHPLDLPGIRLRIASSLGLKDLASCARYEVISRIMLNSNIATLDLRYNLIGDNGAESLSEALKTNSTLTILNLKSNSI
ncbi:hypothetical protein F5H01DRAFT_381076, partial [Linnemannia elongata]